MLSQKKKNDWSKCTSIQFSSISVLCPEDRDFKIIRHFLDIVITKTNSDITLYLMLYAIWNHLTNLKNKKNTHEGVLLLVKFCFSLQLH